MTATLTATQRAAAIHWETSQFSGSTPAATPTAASAITARAAYQMLLYGRAVLVDIRTGKQRVEEGDVDQALGPVVVDAGLLERRFDPRSAVQFPWVHEDLAVLVLCSEGYASAVAAASLVRLGLPRASEVVGGLRAWREAGLPLAA
jgi:rhodanese-related sulfurtransferase